MKMIPEEMVLQFTRQNGSERDDASDDNMFSVQMMFLKRGS